ncbi:CotH kinase family protein [Haliangium sp.]|uniref:CotH kinase family protein n=1 Tax=Haliangium sp. TaxID=2663208 RepID=UPI003D0B2C71
MHAPPRRPRHLLVGLALAALAGCGDDPAPGESGPDAGLGADAAGSEIGPDAAPGPALLCQPAPYWLSEGEVVEIPLLCDQDEGLSGADVVIDGLPAGADYDPEAATITWQPGLDQAAVYQIETSLPDRGDAATITVGVADAWDQAGNQPVVDPSAYPLEYGLPVFFLRPAPPLEAFPDQDDSPYVNAIVDYGGSTYYLQARVRGQTSRSYPKQSYTLRFQGALPFSDPEVAGGFIDKHRVVLTTTFDDNSYLRQRLAFELWNQLDPEHVQVQSFMAVVYLDGEFTGLYTVTDHLDEDLLRQQGLGGDGNLYKAINHDANFRADRTFSDEPKLTLHDGLEKKAGVPADDFADIEALFRFVIDSDDATFAAELGERVALGDYLDWLILASFIAGDDNAGKNAYHYNPGDGPWRMAPWDLNATFGQDWTTARRAAEDLDHYESMNRLFERVMSIPSLRDALAARYRAALDGPLATDALRGRIDALADEIAPVARRDQDRWRSTYESYEGWEGRTDYTSHDEELEYLKTWIDTRWALLDARYP